MLLNPSQCCQHENLLESPETHQVVCTVLPEQAGVGRSRQEHAHMGAHHESHAAAHGEISPGVVQGQCLQRGTLTRAFGSGEPAEMFSTCLLLAAPLGYPSATLVLRVLPDC